MLSGEPAVDTGPKPVPLQCEVLYVDSDCCTHPPGTGQADPGCSTRYSHRSRCDTGVHPPPPRPPSSSVLSPPPREGRGPDEEHAPFLRLCLRKVAPAAPGTGGLLRRLGRLRPPTHRCPMLVPPGFRHQPPRDFFIFIVKAPTYEPSSCERASVNVRRE